MNDSDANSPWDRPTRWDSDASGRPPLPSTPPPVNVAPPPIPTPTPPLPVYGAPDASQVFGGVAPPQTAPVASPVLSGEYGSTEPPVPPAPGRSRSGRFVWIAAVLGAIALLGGGGFFALTALGASGGAETPEEAVDKLIEAANNEDLLAVAELLEPGERRTLADPTLDEIIPELIRLGVLDESFDPASLAGIDLEFIDFQYRIEEVAGAPDIVHAIATGGSAATEFTAADFPMGDTIRSRFGDMIEDSPRRTEPLDLDDAPLVLVERDGRWYISLWYTAAENARLELDESLPSVAEQPPALGSASPEAAVEALVAEMVDLDLRGMIGRLDPDEASALYRYSPLFLGEAQAALDDASRSLGESNVRWDVTDMEFDVDRDGDDAIVRITAFTATVDSAEFSGRLEYSTDRIFVSVDGSILGETFRGTLELTPTRWVVSGAAGGETLDAEVVLDADAGSITLEGNVSGEPFSGSFDIDENGVCSQYTFDGFGESASGCLEDQIAEAGPFGDMITGQLQDGFDQSEMAFAGIPVATRQTDGSWYVSPTGTAMHGAVEYLGLFEREDVEQLLDGFLFLGVGGAGMLDPMIMDGFGGDDFTDLGDFATDDFTVPDFGADLASVDFAVTPGDGHTPYRDQLGRSEQHVYLVEMTEGQTLEATLYGNDVVDGGIADPKLVIENPDGLWHDENDDYDGLNSGVGFTAYATGTWRVIVQELSASPGQYELTLDLVGPGEAPTLLDGISTDFPVEDFPSDVQLDSVDSVTVSADAPGVATGSLEPGTYDLFEVDLPAGSVVTITLEAADGSGLDTNLQVYDSSELLIDANDDAPATAGVGAYDSQVVVNIADGGAYFVEVHSFADIGQGDYTLTISLS